MTRWDVASEITGEVARLGVLQGLARNAVKDGASPDWLDPHDEDSAEEAILDAAEIGRRVCFVRQETDESFGTLAAFCREHGLRYRISVNYSALKDGASTSGRLRKEARPGFLF